MQTMDDSRERDKKITHWMIGIHVFITVLLALIFTVITGMPVLGIPLGIIIWTLILFKTPVFDWCFVNILPNWSIIVGKQTEYDEIPENPVERTRIISLASMREVGPGFRGKFPWEVRYESINLQSEVIIGNNNSNSQPLKCYTLDDIELGILWQVILTPLRGYLVNFVGKDEDAAIAFFRGAFEQAIIKWVKGKNEREVFSALNDLKDEFRAVFSGEDKVDPKEEKWGLFTNDPQIISVNRSARYQSAAEGTKIGEKLSKVIELINAQYPNPDTKPDQNMVLAVASAVVGNDVKGLLLIPGIGKDGGGLMAAAAKLMETLNKK